MSSRRILTFHGRCVQKGRFFNELGIVRKVEGGVIAQVKFDTFPKLTNTWITFDVEDFEPTYGAVRYTGPDEKVRTSAPPNSDYQELLLIAQEKMEDGKWISV